MRPITIDLDVLIPKAKLLMEEVPDLLAYLESAGWETASKIAPLAPLGGKLIGILDKLAGGGTALPSGFPSTGPTGRGRTKYGKSGSQYTDAQVREAVHGVIASKGQVPAMGEVEQMLSFTLSLLFPQSKRGEWEDGQIRVAVDKILYGEDVLPEAVADRFGDMLFYALNVKE